MFSSPGPVRAKRHRMCAQRARNVRTRPPHREWRRLRAPNRTARLFANGARGRGRGRESQRQQVSSIGRATLTLAAVLRLPLEPVLVLHDRVAVRQPAARHEDARAHLWGGERHVDRCVRVCVNGLRGRGT
eukprot:1630655-Prymnesium_polylepis.1